jgi:hypothetical protein
MQKDATKQLVRRSTPLAEWLASHGLLAWRMNWTILFAFHDRFRSLPRRHRFRRAEEFGLH